MSAPGGPLPRSGLEGLIFLKLGGSLITVKERPHTARLDALQRLAREIAGFVSERPQTPLLLGHGSGSFGHVPASRYATRQGVRSAAEWSGFVEVWREAWALNRLVMDALQEAGLPALAFPASAGATADDRTVERWDVSPIQAALRAGLLPVVYGDVVFDLTIGGTICSTEDLFDYLALRLRPARILIAGIEAGVWRDFPQSTDLVEEITPADFPALLPALGGSAATDVTGGMLSKVRQSLGWVQRAPELEVMIFSAAAEGSLGRALRGEGVGTLIHSGG